MRHMRLPIVLLSVIALAAPGGTDAYAKDKGKDKNKGKNEQKADNRGGDRHDDDRDDRDDRDRNRDGKVPICHIPPGNRSARHTIRISESAWPAHKGHGDQRGACRRAGSNTDGAFDQMDVNKDGVISPREWRHGQAAFSTLDRDRDGVISRDEFSRG